jgi:Kef-type K+ transport system membrane component KefB
MHGLHADLLSLLLLLLGSFLMPLLSARIHVPAAVLLIGYGLLVGPQLLDWVPDHEVVGFLYEVGFIVLMFLAGMEIDFNGLRKRGKGALLLLAGICLAVFGLAFLAAFLLDLHPVFGLALGATSVGLPLAILKETGRLRSRTGQEIILLGSVGEFLTVIGMTLFYYASRFGFSLELLWGLGKLAGVLLISGLALRALTAVAWWHPFSFSKLVKADEGSEIGVRAALLTMMLFSVLAIAAGLESIVGAFVAGALIAFVLRGKEVLEEKLAVVGHGLFVPIFFVVVGLRFDPGVITVEGLGLFGLLLLAVFVVRLLPCLALLRSGLSIRGMLSTATLLSAPLTLMVAIAALGSDLGVLQAEGKSTLILLALGSGVVFPVVFRVLRRPRRFSPPGRRTP